MEVQMRLNIFAALRSLTLFLAFAACACANASDSIFSEQLGIKRCVQTGLFAEYLNEDYDRGDNESADNLSNSSEYWLDIEPENFAVVESFAPNEIYGAENLENEFERQDEQGESSATLANDSFSFSKDVIIRGSVNLPSISSIQIWGNGYYGKGHVRPKDWYGRVDEKNSGAVIGLNLPIGVGTISAYYNYHKNTASYARRSVRQKSDGVGMAFYANVGGFYMTALGLYGDDGYTARDLNGRYARSNFGGHQTTGFFETGYEMSTLGMFVLKPFGSYQYTNLQHGNFNTDTLVTRSGKRKYNSCLMTLGSRVILNLAGMDVFTMEGRMAWVTQLRKRNESIHSFCYGRIPGTTTLAQPYYHGRGAGSDAFWGGLGLRLSLLGALSISADYDCLVNKYQTTNEGSLSLLLGF